MTLKNVRELLRAGLLGTKSICLCVRVKILSGPMEESLGIISIKKMTMIQAVKDFWASKAISMVMT